MRLETRHAFLFLGEQPCTPLVLPLARGRLHYGIDHCLVEFERSTEMVSHVRRNRPCFQRVGQCFVSIAEVAISEPCSADHHNESVILGRWLANKTPEIVASWIVHPGNSVLVAVENGTILAVGSVTDAGEITLNYVSLDARFHGVSRALLVALEA